MDHSDDFEGGSSGKPFADRIPIDARDLITEWADTVIASAALREVHLSARGKFGPHGFYRPVYTLKLC